MQCLVETLPHLLLSYLHLHLLYVFVREKQRGKRGRGGHCCIRCALLAECLKSNRSHTQTYICLTSVYVCVSVRSCVRTSVFERGARTYTWTCASAWIWVRSWLCVCVWFCLTTLLKSDSFMGTDMLLNSTSLNSCFMVRIRGKHSVAIVKGLEDAMCQWWVVGPHKDRHVCVCVCVGWSGLCFCLSSGSSLPQHRQKTRVCSFVTSASRRKQEAPSSDQRI